MDISLTSSDNGNPPPPLAGAPTTSPADTLKPSPLFPPTAAAVADRKFVSASSACGCIFEKR